MLDIESKKPLDWYNSEISKTYINLKKALKSEKEQLRIYNSLMISCCEACYEASIRKDKEAKTKYKCMYEVTQKQYYVVADCVIKRKGYSDYLRLLKQKRAEVYDESESRKQSD